MNDPIHDPSDQAPAPWLREIVPALIEFERLPGMYRLALREPQLLFDQPQVVMQLAAGRAVKGMAPLAQGGDAEAAQKAARFFVRMAFLRAGADHYCLLGLTPGFEPQTLRDHYRLMIRLTHPDFATPGEEWPADAASRINLANDVLGSSVKRSEYDAKLLAERAAASVGSPGFGAQVPRSASGPNAPLHPRRREVVRRPSSGAAGRYGDAGTWSPRSKMVLAAGGALACVFALLALTPGGNDGSLVVQRARDAAPAPLTTPEVEAVSETSPLVAEVLAALKPFQNNPDQSMANAPETKPRMAPVEPVKALVRSPKGAPINEPAVGSRASRATDFEAPGAQMAPPNPAVVAPASDRSADHAATLVKPEAVPTPKPFATDTTAEAPKPGAEPLAASAPLAKAAAVAAPDAPKALSMEDVQPLLSKVVEAMSSGVGEDALDVVDPAWKSDSNKMAFLRGYYQFLQGERISGLNSVAFRPQGGDSGLVVNGVFNLKMAGIFDSKSTREFRVRATFMQHKGKPTLTRLEVPGFKP